MEKFAVVEKKNHLAVHGYFYSRKTAEKFLNETIPVYCGRGLYTDKTLTPESFEVIECSSKRQ